MQNYPVGKEPNQYSEEVMMPSQNTECLMCKLNVIKTSEDCHSD